MALASIRTLFIALSGRDDLDVVAPATTAPADDFIRAGSKALDIEGDQDRAIKFYEVSLAAAACRLTVTQCRAIRGLWYWDDTLDEWAMIDPKGFDEILEDYPALDKTASGSPVVWSREPIHEDPDNQAATPTMDTMGIIVMPPTDTAITVKIYGKFYEKSLVAATDVNYWSEVHPQLLVYAALRELEVSYRNTQGYKDWDVRIKEYIAGIDKDLVEDTMKYPAWMEG
jgi:hypothetical protein